MKRTNQRTVEGDTTKRCKFGAMYKGTRRGRTRRQRTVRRPGTNRNRDGEAHESGRFAVNPAMRKRFATDLGNLTLASRG